MLFFSRVEVQHFRCILVETHLWGIMISSVASICGEEIETLNSSMGAEVGRRLGFLGWADILVLKFSQTLEILFPFEF